MSNGELIKKLDSHIAILRAEKAMLSSAWKALRQQEWCFDMSLAPKDKPILALCDHDSGSDHYARGKEMSLYEAHAEGLSTVKDGFHVLEWGGAFSDSWEDGGASAPDWWFQFGSEFEIAAYPVKWKNVDE